ncbi:unnamed protein product, partial [Trichogramma brassicae]
MQSVARKQSDTVSEKVHCWTFSNCCADRTAIGATASPGSSTDDTSSASTSTCSSSSPRRSRVELERVASSGISSDGVLTISRRPSSPWKRKRRRRTVRRIKIEYTGKPALNEEQAAARGRGRRRSIRPSRTTTRSASPPMSRSSARELPARPRLSAGTKEKRHGIIIQSARRWRQQIRKTNVLYRASPCGGRGTASPRRPNKSVRSVASRPSYGHVVDT